MSNTVQVVDFHGQAIQTFLHNNEPHIVMKTIVEGMGLDWSYQRKKLSSNKVRWGVAMIAIPTKGNIQEALCMPLRKLFGWLMTIQPTRVNKSAQKAVIQYQNECDDVLFEYWNKKAVQQQPKLASPYIEGKQLQHIKEGVAKVVHKTGVSWQSAYGELNKTFKAPNINQIEKQYYSAVCAYLGIATDFTVAGDRLLAQDDSRYYVAALSAIKHGARVKDIQDEKLREVEVLLNRACTVFGEAMQCCGAIYDGLHESQLYLPITGTINKQADRMADKQFIDWRSRRPFMWD
ncbi:MAG: phage antirepressor N-terminal domain-containing protein [Gammaproteobacteria bacterium]|nr:phage antirepressor N-terminal domain-containing protein [Gammaproteobacteria bacterium]